MHSRFALLALSAVGAIAAPHQKRDYVYQTDVVTSVVYVTKTYGGDQPAYTPHHPQHQPHHPPPAYTPQPQPQPQPQPYPGGNPDTPDDPSLSGYANAVVKHHNQARAKHVDTKPIVWDKELAHIAYQIASTCHYAHNTEMGGGGYGQNIAAGTPADNIGAVISDQFYGGEVGAYTPYYGMADPPMSVFEQVGHFTQVVWRDTQRVGCYTKHCGALSSDTGDMGGIQPYFTVCNYGKPGNYAGEYAQNVGRPY